MKPALLFGVILIAFSGCRKAEKKPAVPEEVHVINIGSAWRKLTVNNDTIIGFRNFRKFDLLNDSFYIKYNSTVIDSPGYVEVWAGKYDYRKDRLALQFINEALKTKNGQQFVRDPTEMPPLDGAEVHFIQYKRDSLSRYFFYQIGVPFTIGQFIDRLYYFGRDGEKDLVSSKINLHDDSLAMFLYNLPEFKDTFFGPPPPSIRNKIKFTPPVDLEKAE